MNPIKDIFTNYFLMSAAVAWFAAQLIKFVLDLIFNHRVDFRKLTTSGGMPSSHSSSSCALAVAVGIEYGFKSAMFAICFIFGMIVMYDATGVRRETGKQARILNRMVDDIMEKKPVYFQKNLKELIGHTPLEVFAGAVLGIAIAMGMNVVFNH